MVKQKQIIVANKNTAVCQNSVVKGRKEERKFQLQCAAVEVYFILLGTQNQVLLSEKWPFLQKVCSWHEVIIVVKISEFYLK